MTIQRWGLLIWMFCQVAFAMGHQVNEDQAIDQVIARYGLRTEPELIRAFHRAHVSYPPRDVALLAFKKERHMELWAKNPQEKRWHYIYRYPLTAFSGQLGPKLHERDGQIPEGIYRLTSFNPFSRWHLSMLIDYPNAFDRQQASKEGRRYLGSDIFLHGSNKSAGVWPLAIAIEQFSVTQNVGCHMCV